MLTFYADLTADSTEELVQQLRKIADRIESGETLEHKPSINSPPPKWGLSSTPVRSASAFISECYAGARKVNQDA